MAMASWSRITYPKRLFLWLLVYSLLMVGCFVGFQYQREKDFKIDELNAQLQLINKYIFNEYQQGRSIEEMDLDLLSPFDGMRVSVISSDGRLIYDSTRKPGDTISSANHLGRREVVMAKAHGSGYSVRRHSESTGETYFYSALQVAGGNIVRTAVPYSVSLSELLKADYGFMWFMGCVAVVMCIVGFLASRRIGLHIIRLNRFAESADRGEPIVDTEPFPHDELGDISNNIVRLYARLQRANADRDREHRAALHEQREKERIKKQLTNNINHELKTPVASINVCMETLLSHPDIDADKRDEFLRRCLANSERLKRLLNDVSLITRMDDGGGAIVKESLNLRNLIDEVVDECEPMATAHGFEINLRVDGDTNMIGNSSLLSSVFRNLIDNAIAYSGGSSIDIEVHADALGKSLLITIADDGVGVETSHLPRLFERFYRVDKGRSRANGGTGLGLAIVKNAVLIHGGEISVGNRLSGGLVFSIKLPLA